MTPGTSQNVDTSAPATVFRPSPGVIVAASLLAAWSASVFYAILVPADAGAAAYSHTVMQHLGDVFFHVPRNVTAMFVAWAFVAAAWWPGMLVLRLARLPLRSMSERLILPLVVGSAVEAFIVMVLAALHVLYAAPLWLLVAVGIGGAVVEGVRAYDAGAGARAGRPWPLERSVVFAAIVLVASAAFSFVGALSPEVQFDARGFYLAEALRFAQHHGLFNILRDEHFIAYALVHFQELLYAAAIVMGGTAAAKALAWCALPLAAGAVYLLARALQASRAVAVVAAVLFVSTPIVSWSAATASTDLPRVAPDLVALYAVLRWLADREVRWLVLAGAMVGFVLDIKAMGLFSLAALAIVIAVITYRAAAGAPPAHVRIAVGRNVAFFIAPAVIAALPWLITSWIDSGDPVFPFFAAQLAPEYYNATVANDWAHAYEQFGANVSPAAVFWAPWRLTVEADKYRNIIGPVYLALLGLVGYAAWKIRRDAAYRACTAYVAFWFIAL
ncbi:MAG TPA: glycosyltransferase family 39 protein, partial [Xanthomonadales bacterium]|nr:glycosyltransferase family 39 protein [Xanthomonadales bacterium]